MIIGNYELLFGLPTPQAELAAGGAVTVVDTDGMRSLQVRLVQGELRVADIPFAQGAATGQGGADAARAGLLLLSDGPPAGPALLPDAMDPAGH